MTDEKSLIVGTDLTAVELYTAENMDVLLEAIREKVESTVLPDTSTDKNRKEIIAFSFEITQTKTMIQKAALKLTEKWREDTKAVNGAKKTADEFLTQLAKDTRKSVTEWEKAEAKRIEEERIAEENRIEGIRKQITGMTDKVVESVGKTSLEIQETIYAIEDLQITEEGFAEFKDAAWAAKEDAIKKLRDMRDSVKLNEDEAARIAKENLERQEQEKVDRERREAEQRQRDEEQEEIRKKNEAESKRLAAEQEKIDTQKRELAEAEKKDLAPAPTPAEPTVPLDVDIGAPVDTKEAALIALAIVIDNEAAEIVLDMIVAGEVPGVTFNGLVA